MSGVMIALNIIADVATIASAAHELTHHGKKKPKKKLHASNDHPILSSIANVLLFRDGAQHTHKKINAKKPQQPAISYRELMDQPLGVG